MPNARALFIGFMSALLSVGTTTAEVRVKVNGQDVVIDEALLNAEGGFTIRAGDGVITAVAGGIAVNVGATQKEAEEEEASEPLSDEEEAELAEKLAAVRKNFFEAITKAWKTQQQGLLEEVVADITATVDLTETQREDLDAVISQAIEETLPPLLKSTTDHLDSQLPSDQQQRRDRVLNAFNGIANVRTNGDQVAAGFLSQGHFEMPDIENTTAWSEAMKATLTQDQQGQWDKVVAEREVEMKERLDEIVISSTERYRHAFSHSITALASRMRSNLNLKKKRSEAIEGLAEEAIEEALSAWRDEVRTNATALPPSQRRNCIKQERVPIVSYNEYLPLERETWPDGLGEILTSEEIDGWEKDEKRRETENTKAVAALVVSGFDEMLALATDQREAILADVPEMLDASMKQWITQLAQPNGRVYITPDNLSHGVQGDVEKQLFTHLTEGQKTIWEARRSAVNQAGALKELRVKNRENAQVEEEIDDPPFEEPDGGGEEAEGTISEYIANTVSAFRKRSTASMLGEVESIDAIVTLRPEQRRSLAIAAKGAARLETRDWERNVAEYTRRNANGGTAKAVREAINNLGMIGFSANEMGKDTALWTIALQDTLTPSQITSLKAADHQRDLLRYEAIADIVTIQFAAQVGLTAEQTTEIRARLNALLAEEGIDVDYRYRSNRPRNPWFLDSYYARNILGGLDTKELKKLLDDDQWKAWTSACDGWKNEWGRVIREAERRREAEKEAEDAASDEKAEEKPQ